MKKRFPRLAFVLTVIPASIASVLAFYHLFVVAQTVVDSNYLPMLGGFAGSLYLVFDYFTMSLPISLLLITALLINLFWSRALLKLWNISAIAAIAVFLLCGFLILFGINEGTLTVSLNLAVRSAAEAVTAVTLVHSLTKKTKE